VAYFAASTDSFEKNTEFAKSLAVDYPILSDPEGQTVKAYGVQMPIVGVAKRWTFYIGKDGKILYVDRDVHVNSAGADVAARLAELGVAKRKAP
jgi:peroxiredoxin Q/BCP